MKTWPLKNASGCKFAFEIPPPMLLSSIESVLLNVSGVSEVEVRRLFHTPDDVHVRFLFHGRRFMVWEPYGDNSRYWIGPESTPDTPIDVSPLEAEFKNR